MTEYPLRFITPDWPAPANVRAAVSTRKGGGSKAPYDSFNLAQHVGDDPAHVAANRTLLIQQLALPGEPQWLQQVHGTVLLDLESRADNNEADGSYTREANKVCTVLTADCLPILMCTRAGDRVAALHAGWRGLAAGILQQGVAAMTADASELLVWLGPAIGPDKFEVGEDVYREFCATSHEADAAFVSAGEARWYADLYQLARMQLRVLGVDQVFGGSFCTYSDKERFFSFRRDDTTGRMASLIWLTRESGE